MSGSSIIQPEFFALSFYDIKIPKKIFDIRCNTYLYRTDNLWFLKYHKEVLTFKGGLKTESGIGRVVPIHSKVFPIVEKFYTLSKRMNSEYLISQKGGPVRYRYYLDCYNKTCKHLELNANHKPHDARVQFVTMAKKAGVDEYAIKKLLGIRYRISRKEFTRNAIQNGFETRSKRLCRS